VRKRKGILGLVAAALALSAVPALPAGRAAQTGLINSAQLEREQLALRILRRPELREALQRTEAAYAADPAARSSAGRATLKRSAQAIALAAVYYAIGLAVDPAKPQLFWCCKAPHKVGRLSVPGSGYGIDNPDNVYRMTHVDGASRYIVRGRMGPGRPSQLHVEVRDAIPGTTALNAEGGAQLATLRDDALEIAPDGRFAITIDSGPADGRVNHIQIPPAGTHHVIFRDLLTDWTRQVPVAMTIERLGGSDLPSANEAAIARAAADLLDRIAPFWLDYDNRFIFSRPVNSISPARLRPGGRGISASGHFLLRDGEILAITVDPLGAASLGVQLTDPWGVAYDYIGRTSSLNRHQAVPNADGTITVAIARRDPGFVNWLDPSDQASGIMTLRWQGLPADVDPARAIRSIQMVSARDLRVRYTDPSFWLAPEQRNSQRAERRRSHEHRKTVN